MPTTTAISPHIREVLERCIRRADDNVKVITRSATTQDIIDLMLHCDTLVSDDMQELAQYLEGTCPEETMSNIHFVLTNSVEFIEDPNGKQDLMAPNALLKRGYGDCKSLSLCIASICQSLPTPIPYIYRFVSETATGNVHHVYVVAPLADGYEVICDATLDRFNTEPPYAKSIDHIMVADDAQEKVVEQFYSKRGEKMPQSKAVADNDAEGNRSVNAAHIGSIRDRAISKGLKALYDSLNTSGMAEYFCYLFYTDSTPMEMPRLVIKKTYEQLKVYIGFYAALSGLDDTALNNKLIGVRYFQKVVDNYFKGATSISITNIQQSSVPFLNINWGPLANVTMFPGNTEPFLTYGNLDKHISNGMFQISPRSITDLYNQVYLAVVRGTEVTQTIEKAYTDKFNRSLQDFVREQINSALDRSWFLATKIDWVEINPQATTGGRDCEKTYTVEKILTTTEGYSALKLKNDTPVSLNLSIGEELQLTYFANNADGYISLKVKILRWDSNYIILNTLLQNVFTNPNAATLGTFQFICAAQPVNPANEKLVIWLDVPEYQERFFQKDTVKLYSKKLPLFVQFLYITDLSAFFFINSINSAKYGNSKVIEVIGEVYYNGKHGFLLDKGQYSQLKEQNILACIYAFPKENFQTTLVSSITPAANGTYKVQKVGMTQFFDPDGIIDGYLTLQKNQFVTEADVAGINGKKIGVVQAAAVAAAMAILKLIGAILSIISTVVGLVLSIIAMLKKPEMLSGIGNGSADFRYDNCHWYDAEHTQIACLQDDGSYAVFDANWQYIGDAPPDYNPEGSSMEGMATFALIAAGGLFLISGIDDKPKRKTSAKRKVNGRTYTLARRKWKKRA